jgi:hypothetical protein
MVIEEVMGTVVGRAERAKKKRKRRSGRDDRGQGRSGGWGQGWRPKVEDNFMSDGHEVTRSSYRTIAGFYMCLSSQTGLADSHDLHPTFLNCCQFLSKFNYLSYLKIIIYVIIICFITK